MKYYLIFLNDGIVVDIFSYDKEFVRDKYYNLFMDLMHTESVHYDSVQRLDVVQ